MEKKTGHFSFIWTQNTYNRDLKKKLLEFCVNSTALELKS